MSGRYFTGAPCPKGHIAERFASNRQCIECHREYQRDWRRRHPDRMRAIKRKCYERHAEAYREYARQYQSEIDSPAKRAAKAAYDKKRRPTIREKDKER